MNIIDDINSKVQALVNIGLTDEDKVRSALVGAIEATPNRRPDMILNQQYAFMLGNFQGGDTTYVKGE